VSQAVEESYSKTYKMITFIIQFYLKVLTSIESI
jgi:hypothetical protein